MIAVWKTFVRCPDMASLTTSLDAAASDPGVCRALLARLDQLLAGRKLRFMEVCGTHTVSIFQSGLRSLLPASIIHLSGPGCPVCVTHETEIGQCMELAAMGDIIFATFGDLLRVPAGNGQSLRQARARGADIRIVYSPLDAVLLARENPGREVVFAGIGFETTAPGVAAAILAAKKSNTVNFSVLCLHKLVAPAIRSILEDPQTGLDALLLPGHVATITGLAPFQFISSSFGRPAAVAGFEPADILLGLCELAAQIAAGESRIANCYGRAVANEGNPQARSIMDAVFRPVDVSWRGLGLISGSGLAIRDGFADFDARLRFDLKPVDVAPVPGCRCGDVLKGLVQPSQCKLFGRACTPASPVGPCMVSTEGSCAAWHKYGEV